MGIYGDKDIVVHPKQWMPLKDGIPLCRVERLHTAGHFPMLDQPQQFQEILHDFLDSSNTTLTPGQFDG